MHTLVGERDVPISLSAECIDFPTRNVHTSCGLGASCPHGPLCMYTIMTTEGPEKRCSTTEVSSLSRLNKTDCDFIIFILLILIVRYVALHPTLYYTCPESITPTNFKSHLTCPSHQRIKHRADSNMAANR